MYAIARIHPTPNSKAWRVHFNRRGRRFSKSFFDGTFGGSRKALAAAVAWRDNAMAAAPVIRLRDFCKIKRSNNTGGVPGVFFLRTNRQPLGIWQARIWLTGGSKIHRSFSVRDFGSSKAKRRTIAARRTLLRLVDGERFLRR